MAQSVERPALDFSFGHDLTVCVFELSIWLAAVISEAVSTETASDPLSPFLSDPPPLPLSLSKINKIIKKMKSSRKNTKDVLCPFSIFMC